MLITSEENYVWEEEYSPNSQKPKPNCFKNSSQLLEICEVKNGKIPAGH